MSRITDILQSYKRKGIGIAVVLLLFFGVSWYLIYLSTPPVSFDNDTQLEISSGMSVRDIANAAAQQGLIRSDTLLYAILTYFYDPTNIYAGTYVFENPTSVFGVAQKLAKNDIQNQLTRITIPEGVSARTIAHIASKAIPQFDTEKYLAKAIPKEGYLFPETYFVPIDFTEDDLLSLQEETYKEKILPLKNDIAHHTLSEYEILTLASIIEREANDPQSMKIISGILQNRLAIGMPLQADASIEYILDKPLNQLTPEDLKIDSPYNTYLNKGLPPTPIGNPGIMAITAVLTPIASDNLFYVTAPDGTFYYAKTLAGHNKNIANYLR